MLSDSLFDNLYSLNEDLIHYENQPELFGYDPKLFELIRNYMVPLRHIQGLLDCGAPDDEIIKMIRKDYPIPNEKLDIVTSKD